MEEKILKKIIKNWKKKCQNVKKMKWNEPWLYRKEFIESNRDRNINIETLATTTTKKMKKNENIKVEKNGKQDEKKNLKTTQNGGVKRKPIWHRLLWLSLYIYDDEFFICLMMMIMVIIQMMDGETKNLMNKKWKKKLIYFPFYFYFFIVLFLFNFYDFSA